MQNLPEEIILFLFNFIMHSISLQNLMNIDGITRGEESYMLLKSFTFSRYLSNRTNRLIKTLNCFVITERFSLILLVLREEKIKSRYCQNIYTKSLFVSYIYTMIITDAIRFTKHSSYTFFSRKGIHYRDFKFWFKPAFRGFCAFSGH